MYDDMGVGGAHAVRAGEFRRAGRCLLPGAGAMANLRKSRRLSTNLLITVQIPSDCQHNSDHDSDHKV